MRKIRWGVLGTASIARRATIPGMQKAENCGLWAIAGRSLEKAEEFRREFGFAKAYGSYEALLADPDVEAVYLPLPNSLHCEWAVRALRAKKHVLCEKPLAPTAAQVAEMQAAARENGVFLMEAFAYLHSPFTAAIRAELARKTIGEPLYMESEFLTSDYDERNIRMRPETFGGSIYDLGCYPISQILWLLGGEPASVQVTASFLPQGIDAYASGLLTFPGGARAAFHCGMVLSRTCPQRVDRFRIHGTRGALWSDAEFNEAGEVRYTVSADGQVETKSVTAPDNYGLEVAQLGRCIADGEQPWVSPEFSLRNARVMDRVLSAAGYRAGNPA